ncbi:hypothetical protein G3N59_21340 [Paraburkholderia sp. Ac-20340]|nr:hypothetical protein [Paraburkholderia sp. Ac-20340]
MTHGTHAMPMTAQIDHGVAHSLDRLDYSNRPDTSDCRHHAGCCSQGCGSHCGAPPLASHVDHYTRAHDAPSVPVAALRAGITHAPPLPPPIV